MCGLYCSTSDSSVSDIYLTFSARFMCSYCTFVCVHGSFTMLVNCRFRSLCRFTNFYTKVWLILEMENSQWELVLR